MALRWDEKRQRFIVDYYTYYENEEGKRIRRRPRITLPANISKETAEAIARDLDSGNNGEADPSGGTLVSDLFVLYLREQKMYMTESTWNNVKWTYDKHIKKTLGNFRISEIEKGHIKVYQKVRKETGVCGRTVNKEVNYFMGFLKWCRSEHNMNIPDCRPAALPHAKKPTLTLSIQEAMALILHAETKYAVLFLAMYLLGLRFSEATSLEWSDIDWSNRTIRIIGKGSTEKLLPVPEWFFNWLKLIQPEKKKKKDSKPDNDLVFQSNRTGGRIVNVKRAIERARVAAGIEKHVHPHLLRHTLATQLGGLNINMKQIQLLMRHAQESTTADLYTHLIVDHLRPAQDILMNAISHTLKEDALKKL